MHKAILAVGVLIIALASPGEAQCPFSLSNNPTDPVESLSIQSCSLVSGTTYDLEVKVIHSSSDGRFFLNVDSDVSIRHLTFDVQGADGAWPNVIATIKGPNDLEGETYALQAIESLKVDPDSTGYLSIALLRVEGDVGAMEFFQLYDADVLTGSVLGPVDVREQEIYLPGAPTPRIDLLRVGGDLLGDITFHSGGRLAVLSVIGDIGSPTGPVALLVAQTGLGGSGGNVGTIECSNLYGEVTATSNVRRIAAAGMFVGNLSCATIGPSHIGSDAPGVFIGSGGFDGSIEVLGAVFEGDILITGDLASGGLLAIPVLSEGDSITITGSVESGSIIEISGSLDGDIHIQETQGLQGQILINAAIASAPPVEGEWTGSVAVGTGGSEVTIGGSETGDNEAPTYGVLSSTLGGGAIGLVPFMYHAKESTPAHDTVITTGAFTGTVTVEHYGPVADADDDTSTTPPVKV